MGLFSKKYKDPVCSMTVNPADAAAQEPHKDHTDYFCSTSCAAKFRADPSKFA